MTTPCKRRLLVMLLLQLLAVRKPLPPMWPPAPMQKQYHPHLRIRLLQWMELQAPWTLQRLRLLLSLLYQCSLLMPLLVLHLKTPPRQVSLRPRTQEVLQWRSLRQQLLPVLTPLL